MDGYNIGISGINAAQKALEIIGNNIANAATEGYHRQRIDLTPAYSSLTGSDLFGGGVDIAAVTRLIDHLLQEETLLQQSASEQVSQELTTLSTVESAFGELSDNEGLNAAIDGFFNALQDLCSHPTDITWQNQAVTAAETMTAQFRFLGEFLATSENQIALEAKNTVEQINILVGEIAELNGNIERQEVSGRQANNLKDQRDQSISELSKLVGIETLSREYGIVDVSIAGIPVVSRTSSLQLELGSKENGVLGLGVAGESNYNMNVRGGQLGGLLSLKNEIISGIQDDLDTLARAIIQVVNQHHVQGVGSEGSFTEATGWSMTSENLADFDAPVSDGNIYVRVTNTSTGEVTRATVSVDASTDSLTTLAYKIAAVPGLSASAFDSRLHIEADTGYEFDFLPCVLPSPTATDFTGATSPPAVSISGIYSGTENQTYTFTVSGTGSVSNGTLQILVTDGDGNTVTTLDVGAGYPAGDTLDLGNGISIALGAGDLVDGNTFEVDLFTETDTSGILAAAGINTFFSGNNAMNMAVCEEITNTPGRIATALGADGMDNTNALRLQDLRDHALNDLNSMTPGEFYRQLATDIGQQVSVKQIRQNGIEAMIQNLANQENEISGVDVNDEAARMLVFEQMFNAMAKYMSTIQTLTTTLMQIM